MPRRPAIITQADVARCVRAAMQAGACGVEIRPDGTIFVALSPSSTPAGDTERLEHKREIVL